MEDGSVNPILDYVQKLTRTKKGLPHAQPVCVLASLKITTAAELLKLAAELGPHMTIFQIQADSINDWHEGVIEQLVYLSKKHGFILWEGSRILNATFAVPEMEAGGTQSQMNHALINMITRRYVGGHLKAAEWSGLSTSWAASVPYNHQEKDLLMPSLRKAVRQVVSSTAKTIQTEISAAEESEPIPDHLEVPLSPPSTGGWSEFSAENMGLALRKMSTISVTESTTTQPFVQTDEGIPPPPSHSRGMVLCLPPSSTNTPFKPDFRQSTLVAACANPDFVVGVVCTEPLYCAYAGNTLIELATASDQGVFDKNGDSVLLSSPYIDTECTPAVFSLVPPDVIVGDAGSDDDDDEEPNETHEHESDDTPTITKLYRLMDQAFELREASRQQYTPPSEAHHQYGPNLYHIPVVILP
ncbi:hypothetical protein N7478_003922 [Penicillium angulare]|uniref:uncharacterized protein n=1 Tax=Penicillium angulare TaxID=116970 RepID=UPI002541742C|nr:uncharacterized protein N7478_003922 [Penicillium angulare]KAJ5288236.1 hypothetical protein N7478_003922 [Penicillium angulare]